MNTPTPWVVVDDVYIVGGDQAFVTKCSGRLNDKANAALICRAVNSHESLVAALEQQITLTVDLANGYRTDLETITQMIQDARAALALAKGEA